MTGDGATSKVDEELLACAVLLPHDHIQPALPFPVGAELAVLVVP